MNAEIVWRPQPRQAEFMRRPEPEALYGGAAGGGKSDALVIEALRQVHIPHYRGLILRKTYPQLSDLVDKSMVYYKRAFPAAQYNATSHVWVFPSGAKIYFGSRQYTKDRTNYQGKAFDFIGFDELTHFEWEEYSYMMSRNRPTGPGTRVYLRATTNPGGVGHGWVKARFITPAPAHGCTCGPPPTPAGWATAGSRQGSSLPPRPEPPLRRSARCRCRTVRKRCSGGRGCSSRPASLTTPPC